jgi:diketogulonate reductase-like aldo/keto reductase
MQVGILPLTGTTNEQHMKEDLAVEKFSLSEAEVERIETIAMKP